MTIQINITNTSSRIISPISEYVNSALEKEMSYEVKGKFFTDAYQQGWWDGRVKLYSMKTKIFPTGLLYLVRKVLEQNTLEYEYIDNRITCEFGKELPLQLEEGMELYDYQRTAIDEAIKKTRGIIKIGTGGGKSLVISGILAKGNLPSIILIHRKDIAQQLKNNLEEHLKVPIGLIGAGGKQLENITVMMAQTASKTKDKEVKKFIDSASCLIIDECHITAAKGVYNVAKQCKSAFLRYGTSATPYRYDDSSLFINAATGDRIIDVGASELIEKGYLVPPHIYMIEVPKIPELQNFNYQEAYQTGIVENKVRNGLITDLCNFLVNKKKTILIAVTRIEHGNTLIDILHNKYPKMKSIFVHGSDEDFLRKEVLEDLRNKRLGVVIATNIFNEGVDIPALDTLINCTAQDSDVAAYQLIGRVLRKFEGKKNAIVIDFHDKSKYLHKHSIHREKIYIKEPQFLLYKCKTKEEAQNIITAQERFG